MLLTLLHLVHWKTANCVKLCAVHNRQFIVLCEDVTINGADTDTYTGPVSAQTLQMTPDRRHTVVENLERPSKLRITAWAHRPSTCILTT